MEQPAQKTIIEPFSVSTKTAKEQLAFRQVDILYDNLHIVIFSNLFIGGLLLSILWSHVSNKVLLGWGLALVIISAVRYLSRIIYKKSEKEIYKTSREKLWLNRFIWLSGLTGFLWSSLIILVTHLGTDLLYVGLTILFVSGLCAGSFAYTALVRSLFLVFAGSATLPASTYLLFTQEYINVIFALCLISYYFFLSWMGIKLNQVVLRELKLDLENTLIAAYLSNIFYKANEGYIIVDPISRSVVDANLFATNMLGYKNKELVGLHCGVVFCNDEVMMKKIFESESGIKEEIAFTTKQGDIKQVEMATSKLESGNNEALILIMLYDLTERYQATQTSTLLQESRNVNRAILQAQEEERKYIAHELHDEIAQYLTAIEMNIHFLSKQSDKAPSDQYSYYDKILSAVEYIHKTVRSIHSRLRPALLDQEGLLVAIQHTLDIWSNEYGIKCELTCAESFPEKTLSDEISISLFRILQESLTNIAKHAKATHVAITLEYDSEMQNKTVNLSICDNGVGFLENERNYGKVISVCESASEHLAGE